MRLGNSYRSRNDRSRMRRLAPTAHASDLSPAVSSSRDDNRRSERTDCSAAGHITGIVTPACQPGPRNQAGQGHDQPSSRRHRDRYGAGECDRGARMRRRERGRGRLVARHHSVSQNSRTGASSADHPFDDLGQHRGQSNCHPATTQRPPSTWPSHRQHRRRRQPRLEIIAPRHQRADDWLGPGSTTDRHAAQQRHICVRFARAHRTG